MCFTPSVGSPESQQLDTKRDVHVPKGKIVAVGSFLAAGINKGGSVLEKKIATTYDRKISETQAVEEPRQVKAAHLQGAKAAEGASKGFVKVAGVAAGAMDKVAEGIASKVWQHHCVFH